MISVGARNDTGQLFARKTAVKRKKKLCRIIIGGCQFRCVILPLQFHALLERETRGGKKRLDKVGAVGQQSLDDVDVHFVAVPAERVIAVNIPVTVHKILHITAILFAVDFDLLEINCFCFGKQGEKFFRHVLCRFNVMRVFAPLKKREGRNQLLSCRFTFNWFIIYYEDKAFGYIFNPIIPGTVYKCKFDMRYTTVRLVKHTVDQIDGIILFLVDDFGVHLCHFHVSMAKQLGCRI